MKTKHTPTRPAQPEIRMPQTEDFALIQQTTADGERITREAERKARDRAECEAKQQTLFA